MKGRTSAAGRRHTSSLARPKPWGCVASERWRARSRSAARARPSSASWARALVTELTESREVIARYAPGPSQLPRSSAVEPSNQNAREHARQANHK